MASGTRPVIPPSAKMAEIVRSGDCCPRQTAPRKMATNIRFNCVPPRPEIGLKSVHRFTTDNLPDKSAGHQRCGRLARVHVPWVESRPKYAVPCVPGLPENRTPACDGSESREPQRT